MQHTTIEKILHVAGGKVSTAAISFLSFFLIARYFESHDVGEYIVATSLATIVAMIANCGVNEFVFRECSVHQERESQLLTVSKMSKAFFGIGLGVLLIAIGIVFDIHFLTSGLFVAVLASALIDAQTVSYIMIFRARGNTRIELIVFPLRAASRLLIVAIAILVDSSLLGVVLGVALINSVFLWAVSQRYRGISAETAISPVSLTDTVAVIRGSAPYAVSGMVAALYMNSAPLVIQVIEGAEAAAKYGVAWQVFQALAFVPVSINIATQPELTRLFERDRTAWFDKTSELLIRLSVVAVASGIAASLMLPDLVVWAFGQQYSSSKTILSVLLIAYIFRFVTASHLVGVAMSSKNVSKYYQVFAAALVIKLIGNVLLVWSYGAEGAPYALVISEMVMCLSLIAWWRIDGNARIGVRR